MEKLLKDKRKELGPLPDDDDMASPKLKLSKAASHLIILVCWIAYCFLKIVVIGEADGTH